MDTLSSLKKRERLSFIAFPELPDRKAIDQVPSWKIYGRKDQLSAIQQMLDRGRWFFAKITGRRRIGKTTLIQRALQSLATPKPIFYVQIPDSEPIGILSAVNDALDTFAVPSDQFGRPTDMSQLAKLIEAMATAGYVVVLDEFQ